MKFFKAIRYSGIGVFVTGIVAVIQGCDAREGAAAFFLLFLLQFCSGPGVDMSETGSSSVPPLVVDPFTTATSPSPLSGPCGAAFATDLSQPIADVFGGFRDTIATASIFQTGSGTVSITIGGGTATISSTGLCDFTINVIIFDYGGALTVHDFSAYTEFFVPVVSISGGTVTGCRFSMRDSSGGIILFTSAGQDLVPPGVAYDISGVARSAVGSIFWGTGCVFSAGVTVELGPLVLR